MLFIVIFGKKILKIVNFLLFLFSFALPYSLCFQPVFAGSGIVSEKPNAICELADIFENLIGVVGAIAGVLLFVFLVIGGFSYLSSGGEPKSTESAKNTITYALIGIVFLLLAWFLLYFIQEFTGVKVTEFIIPCPPEAGS